ncbi:hypothetical protein, partial [Actinoplanes sp. TFC3]|uniref:hypothetical protein n=1 Tax=Actinoplanes sp. TFC3 TaxID=1710355 RepID=UPI001F281B2F
MNAETASGTPATDEPSAAKKPSATSNVAAPAKTEIAAKAQTLAEADALAKARTAAKTDTPDPETTALLTPEGDEATASDEAKTQPPGQDEAPTQVVASRPEWPPPTAPAAGNTVTTQKRPATLDDLAPLPVATPSTASAPT